jgi:hypothetical protein
MELAVKFHQDRDKERFFPRYQSWESYKSKTRQSHSSSSRKTFCCHTSSKTINSELCKAINSFSLHEAVAGVPREEQVTAVKETAVKQLL